MFTATHLNNFKCYKNQIIPLAPLTLLTGFNAAGKSTVIQSLLLGSQMARGNGNPQAVPLNGSLIKLGTVGDVVHHLADQRKIKLRYETDQEQFTLKLDASERHKTTLRLDDKLPEQHSILDLLENIIYLNATRIGIQDVFPSPEDSDPVFADVGESGQFAPWWFDQYADEPIEQAKKHPAQPAPTLRKQFNAWADTIFPQSEANTQHIDRTPLIRLELRISLQQQWQRPANIGYGLTYAFPILVAGLLAKKGQVLIIDSPEAHLHPMGQSKIGYFLATMAASGVQVIIETHSDHVLNGVRLSIAQHKINADQVMIHFFSPSHDPSHPNPQIVSPMVNQAGQLSEWPDGFFDQSDKDLADLNHWG